jgi:lysophospholipase L1-like esterase
MPRILQRSILVLAATLVGILLAEGLARLFGLGPIYGRIFSLGDIQTRTVDGVVLWTDRAPRYDDDDIRRAADPATFTVLGLGDSIMYGVGQAKRDTYFEQARRVLAQHSKRQIEMLNLAVPGFNTMQENAAYEEIEDRIKPNLVLVHYWLDDDREYRVVHGYVVDIGDMSADGHMVVRALPLPQSLNDFLLVHSSLYDLLTQAVVAHDRNAVRSDPERVHKPLLAIQKRARRAGARVIVLASPELDGPVPRPLQDLPFLRKFAAAHGIEVIDVSQWVRGVESKRIAMDRLHFNAEGHRIVGEHLADYLLEHDLKE